MKIKLQSIIFLLFFISISSVAQINFDADTTAVMLEDTDDVVAYNKMRNGSDVEKTYIWRRIIVEANTEWTTAVCDNITCWTEMTDSSQVTLAGKESGDLIIHLNPHGALSESGIYHIEIEEVGNPDNKATAVYMFNADLTGVDDIEVPAIQIHPNPSQGVFSLTDDENSIDRVQIYSFTGQMMAEFDLTAQKWIDMTHFSEGMYLIQMIGRTGENLGTQMITKL